MKESLEERAKDSKSHLARENRRVHAIPMV